VQGHFDLRANYDHDNGATGQLFTGIISDKGMLSALLDQAGNYYLHAAIGSKQESLCFAFDKKCKVEREQSAEIHFLNNYYSATCKSEQIWISDGIAAKWVQEVSCSEPFPGSLTIFFAEELEAKVYMPLRFMPGASFEGSASAQLHVDGVFAGLHEVDLPGFSVEMGGKVGVCWKRKVGCLDIEFGASVQGAAGYDSCKEAGYINSDVCPVFRCEFKY